MLSLRALYRRLLQPHVMFMLKVRSGPPAPPNSAFGSDGLSGVSGTSRNSGTSDGSPSSGGEGLERAGELIVLGCMLCSYGLIGAGALHTLLVRA